RFGQDARIALVYRGQNEQVTSRKVGRNFKQLGIKWDFAETDAMDSTLLRPAIKVYESAGLDVTIGGSGFE
ncbi:MAG: hypothetical protein SVP26_10335, partial [Chloroflexota bacterium]|nr:hypothetical protein [Chloroflexota bacterium]